MPDMSEFHETEEEMEDRCDAQRDDEKLRTEETHPLTAMLERLKEAGRK